eukprot:12562010-Alexandrium_andersonii.AAC.1
MRAQHRACGLRSPGCSALVRSCGAHSASHMLVGPALASGVLRLQPRPCTTFRAPFSWRTCGTAAPYVVSLLRVCLIGRVAPAAPFASLSWAGS